MRKIITTLIALVFTFGGVFAVYAEGPGGQDLKWQENYVDFMGSGFDTADGSASQEFIDATVESIVPRAGAPVGGTAVGRPISPSTLKTTKTSPLLFLYLKAMEDRINTGRTTTGCPAEGGGPKSCYNTGEWRTIYKTTYDNARGGNGAPDTGFYLKKDDGGDNLSLQEAMEMGADIKVRVQGAWQEVVNGNPESINNSPRFNYYFTCEDYEVYNFGESNSAGTFNLDSSSSVNDLNISCGGKYQHGTSGFLNGNTEVVLTEQTLPEFSDVNKPVSIGNGSGDAVVTITYGNNNYDAFITHYAEGGYSSCTVYGAIQKHFSKYVHSLNMQIDLYTVLRDEFDENAAELNPKITNLVAFRDRVESVKRVVDRAVEIKRLYSEDMRNMEEEYSINEAIWSYVRPKLAEFDSNFGNAEIFPVEASGVDLDCKENYFWTNGGMFCGLPGDNNACKLTDMKFTNIISSVENGTTSGLFSQGSSKHLLPILEIEFFAKL